MLVVASAGMLNQAHHNSALLAQHVDESLSIFLSAADLLPAIDAPCSNGNTIETSHEDHVFH